ncbi:MAG: hypothetical protein ABGY72_24555, partial [bacterium]
MGRRVGAVGAVVVAVATWASLTPQAAGQQPDVEPSATAVSPQRALVDEYCVTCHNGDYVNGTDEPRSLLISQL